MRTNCRHRDAATENNVIADGHVSAEQYVVGEGHVIANLAVVGDVGTDHEEAVVTDFGDTAASSVPVFIVTFSRMSQSAPTTRRVGPPR